MPPAIRQLAERLLQDPVSVSVDPVSSAAERVEQKIYFVDKSNKRRLLLDLLDDPSLRRVLVFSRTKHGANRIVKSLQRAELSAAAIHSNKSQGARTRALAGFRQGNTRVLVATDIAARGIDVEGITHVINFDLPNISETYVHRIGRTGRAGASGLALSFCDFDEREYLEGIERLIKQHIERVEDHRYPPEQPLPPLTDLASNRSQRSGRGSSGRRNSSGNKRGGGRRGNRSGHRSGSRGRGRR